jgi:hypothetical protein
MAKLAVSGGNIAHSLRAEVRNVNFKLADLSSAGRLLQSRVALSIEISCRIRPSFLLKIHHGHIVFLVGVAPVTTQTVSCPQLL